MIRIRRAGSPRLPENLSAVPQGQEWPAQDFNPGQAVRSHGRSGCRGWQDLLRGGETPTSRRLGVHREALAALRLFEEAADRETATAELARRILDFLFRARYDEGLRFTAS